MEGELKALEEGLQAWSWKPLPGGGGANRSLALIVQSDVEAAKHL